MDRAALAIPLTVVAGGFIALQAPINGNLGVTIGRLPAATISFAIGTAALVAITLLLGGGFGQVGGIRTLAPVYLTGGVLGAIYVTVALTTVQTLGAGGVTAATITGQLTLSVVIDRLGILGLDARPLTLGRIAGVALLAAGLFLIVRN
jgi:transporter family-2 protein